MTIHDLTTKFRYIASASACVILAIICTSCFANRHKTQRQLPDRPIVYHVFDSLELILSKRIQDIKNRHPNNCSTICFTITPAANYLKPYSDSNVYNCIINIFYEFPASKWSILNATDRYVEICKNRYPVYLYCFDDIFTLPDSIKNFSNEKLPDLFDINSELSLIVNMSTKKVLFAR